MALKLTIKETMYYFGLLYEMNLKLIKKRLEFLEHFLNLPTASQLSDTLRFVPWTRQRSKIHKYIIRASLLDKLDCSLRSLRIM